MDCANRGFARPDFTGSNKSGNRGEVFRQIQAKAGWGLAAKVRLSVITQLDDRLVFSE